MWATSWQHWRVMAGEVRRNPYHARLPAWMMDNVRRGAELWAGLRLAGAASSTQAAFASPERLRPRRRAGRVGAGFHLCHNLPAPPMVMRPAEGCV